MKTNIIYYVEYLVTIFLCFRKILINLVCFIFNDGFKQTYFYFIIFIKEVSAICFYKFVTRNHFDKYNYFKHRYLQKKNNVCIGTSDVQILKS